MILDPKYLFLGGNFSLRKPFNYYTADVSVKNSPKTGISGPKTQFLALYDDDEIFEEKRGRLFVKGGGGGGGGFPSIWSNF